MSIGVHESVDSVFPATELVQRLTDLPRSIRVVDGDGARDCEAVVTFEHDDAFLDGPEWIHSIQAGIDRFPLSELTDRGVALTNSTGIHGDAVGETVTGYALAFARRLHTHRSNQERHEWSWPAWDDPFTVNGESMCVVGLGTLGRGIAARADALGMGVTGVKRTPTPVDHVEEVYPSDELLAAVADARFVALAVPLTDRTEELVGRDELAAMRADAYLLNVARGGVVDQSSLEWALETGEIAGAGLDVFETEPLPEDSPLWDHEEVLVTPHAAAATRDYCDRIATLVRENVKRRARGEAMANRVV